MRFILRRTAFFLFTMWAAVTVNFVIPRLMPGNPALSMIARYKGHINGQGLKALELLFGVRAHESILSEYFIYLDSIFHGRFGISYTFYPESVTHEVMQAIPWTLGLVGMTTILAFILGTLIGLVSAWRRGGMLDSMLPPIFVITSAFPYFWIALLCVWLFGIKLNWLPEFGGYAYQATPGWQWGFVSDVLVHSILPATTILVTSIGGWILTMRNNVISVLGEDYVRMARAKGLKPWTVMWGYAGRNAILPNLTGFAMSLGFVVSGAILVEYVFNYPGVGWMLLDAVSNEDYPLMQALFLLITLAVLTAVLLADIATALLDARTRDLS
ncbi:MAG: ABC transporter permease [Acidimicrobiales bacterium]